jgi:ubiquinone/menaquinone biosynthesis C-methylase UbiE
MDTGAQYDSIARFYDEIVRDDLRDPGTSALLELTSALESTRVLDVACGQGRISRELARRGATVVGIDISEELLVIARNAEAELPLGVTYLRGDVAQPDVLLGEGEGFDGVACNFGLSDIDDLDGALTTVERVLRQGGWFVFSILSPYFPGWDKDAPSSWSPDAGYYREEWWLAANSGFRGRVGANHRMLSTYLNALVRHGLYVEQAVEPDPGEAWAARVPGRAAVPVYLVARCRKGVT